MSIFAKVRVARSIRVARSKILQRNQMLETVLRGRFCFPTLVNKPGEAWGKQQKANGGARSDRSGVLGILNRLRRMFRNVRATPSFSPTTNDKLDPTVDRPTFRNPTRATGEEFIFISLRQQRAWVTGADGI